MYPIHGGETRWPLVGWGAWMYRPADQRAASAPLSLARSARASASIIVGAPFRSSRVGDRTDSYSCLWQDSPKLASRFYPLALRAITLAPPRVASRAGLSSDKRDRGPTADRPRQDRQQDARAEQRKGVSHG